ncbi:hypothetical protein MMC08_001848 [Hypocenomyce scalaris]|nr:hypothetical protein [Hypocenomyce scalaris]
MVATVTSSRTPSSIPTAGSSYRFNADASNNVAVYYGQTAATGQVNLTSLCEDQSVDIVILAFLTEYFGPGGYPTVNFGATCGGQSQEQQQAGASGLLSCGILASQVATCQEIGKKVLLSLGGAISTSSFNSDQQATQFAIQLWNLFGGGSNYSTGLRPFGSIKVDGFDIGKILNPPNPVFSTPNLNADNEDDSTSYYNTFATSLRSQFSGDSSKTYYISAAPQCPIPDASIPLQAMQQADFVWVQFYNNGDCNVGQSGFSASFSAWSSDLSAAGKGPKLYIGAPAWSGGGTGYLPPSEMASVIQGAKALGESNFGGVMLWDGSEAQVNGEYQQGVKSALQ